jgi:DNA ligase (NAD+)
MKAMIEQHGGKVVSAVSGKLDYLLAGNNVGPAKKQKAEKLGIDTLSEQEFLKMLA